MAYAVGGQYFAFLKRSREGVRPKEQGADSGFSYGPIGTFFAIMYQGYGMMPTQYVCVFDGKEVRQQCNDGSKLNTYQVRLPEGVKTYPPESDGPISDRKWVEKSALEFALSVIQSDK